MSSASDKARFHIEQTVIDLREWERRQLFSKAELTSITSQRTSYETQLNSREASPSLYIRYITYESNVASLLSKRLSRHSVPPKSAQKLRASQQRRLFTILDRATRKFHGDLNLWAQYLHFCREQAANRRGQRVLTECLRLFPTRPEVWGYAARWAEGGGDLNAARGYYLRGLRFCGKQLDGGKELYLKFARAEMRWIGERRRVLGLKNDQESKMKEVESPAEDAEQKSEEDADADLITLPSYVKADDVTEDATSFRHFSSTPAMTGAIPMAIFDQAMNAYNNEPKLSSEFFETFAQFPQLPCTRSLLEHVVKHMSKQPQNGAIAQSSQCRLPLIGIAIDSPDFPPAIRASLNALKSSFLAIGDDDNAKVALSQSILMWLRPLTEDSKLVPELKAVLGATLKQLERTGKTVVTQR